MKDFHIISNDFLIVKNLENISKGTLRIYLSQESIHQIKHCRQYLEQKLQQSDQSFYGINTGFGSLCNQTISAANIEELQENLVMSHACGMGDLVPLNVIRLMLFLKIQSLSYGYSGVRHSLVEKLIEFYNHDILPVIYQQGSLGASGDLSPLAHLALPLIGKGEVWYKGERRSTEAVFQALNWKPIRLKSKEGLALLNGTQFSTAYGAWCLVESERLLRLANICAALSIDAFNCSISPFDPRLHHLRGHMGQIDTAIIIRELLEGSEIIKQEKTDVQDPYAFRCVPQVHGASTDTINYAKLTIFTEANAVTDNPNLFPDDDKILSGGNFHAQPVALALDFLAIALSELGSISERRTYQLISEKRNLPAFLIKKPGLHSGFMIPQYTAASIVSQNKQLCTPASVDSIVSCNGQEDHVSMAANAATKLYKVVQNLERILAIEFMTAAQALEFRRPLKTSPKLEEIVLAYRQKVSALEVDRILSEDMRITVDFLKTI